MWAECQVAHTLFSVISILSNGTIDEKQLFDHFPLVDHWLGVSQTPSSGTGWHSDSEPGPAGNLFTFFFHTLSGSFSKL